jgi:hypothetical protein
MFLTNKLFDAIDENDLQSLIDNQIRESREIDYKSHIVGDADAEKKEFLADISSFGNASGGYLIFGIEEKDGIPKKLCGVNVSNIDAEIRRIENIIRDGIEPRITGIIVKAIPLSSSEVIILVRIPRSWALPHMVSFKGHTRFYARNSAGKYPLDITEIRGLFALSETVTEKIKGFRVERLSQIIASETPVLMDANSPKTVLHLIPLDAFDLAKRCDISGLSNVSGKLPPLSSAGWDYRFNFDGFLTYSSTRENLSRSYLQIFRTGIIEAVCAQHTSFEHGNSKTIYGTKIEKEVLKAIPEYLLVQNQLLETELPIVITISLIGIKGYTMYVKPNAFISNDAHPIEKDTLLLPDVLIENINSEPDQYMRPVFDTLWNATGWFGSLNYDENGKWVER